MKWIREHKLISALVSILLALAIVFVVSLSQTESDNVVSDVVNRGMGAVSGGLTSAVRGIKNTFTGIFAYKSLSRELEDAQKENANLKRQLTEAKLQREQLEELEDLSALLNYDYTNKKFDIVSADVISYDGSNWTNIMTINEGTEEGIEIGDAVVNGIGLVGRIEEVGKGWSKVVSITDEDCKVSFKLARDRKQLGIAHGNEDGTISGFMLNGESLVSEGDILVTSGLGTYPKGLEIGTAKKVAYNSNTLLKELVVEPAVDFKSIDKVAVIK